PHLSARAPKARGPRSSSGALLLRLLRAAGRGNARALVHRERGDAQGVASPVPAGAGPGERAEGDAGAHGGGEAEAGRERLAGDPEGNRGGRVLLDEELLAVGELLVRGHRPGNAAGLQSAVLAIALRSIM